MEIGCGVIMSAPAAIERIWTEVKSVIPGVRLSGIVSLKRGYHGPERWVKINFPGDYSIVMSLDMTNENYSSAIDLTLSTANMIKITQGLYNHREELYYNGEPILREFIGTLDGDNVFCFDFHRGVIWGRALSHLWHLHLSIHRVFANNWEALKILVRVIKKIFGVSEMAEFDLPGKGDTGDWVEIAQRLVHMFGQDIGVYPEGHEKEGKPLYDKDFGPLTVTAINGNRQDISPGVGQTERLTAWHFIQLIRQLVAYDFAKNMELWLAKNPDKFVKDMETFIHTWLESNKDELKGRDGKDGVDGKTPRTLEIPALVISYKEDGDNDNE